MSRYTSIPHNQWYRREVTELKSAEALLVYQFLRTAPTMTALGCCVVAEATISALTFLPKRKVSCAIRAILDAGLVRHDQVFGLFYVKNHFTENPIRNPNCAIAALKTVQELPPSALLAEVAQDLYDSEGKAFAERFALIQALQERCGVWTVGKRQPELFDIGVQSLGLSLLESLPERSGDSVPQSLGEPIPYTVAVASTITNTVLPKAGAKAVPNTDPEGMPPPLERLERFADEVSRYTQRPLCDPAFSGGMAPLLAVEATLADLAAACPAWEQEVRDRMRREKEVAAIRVSKCPAGVIGKLARWALKDIRGQKTGGGVIDESGLSARARERLETARRIAADGAADG